jgi:hypothetical protein
MKKYFSKQHANLSNRGAMETGDHFKNGAKPKSQTSKGNYVFYDCNPEVEQAIRNYITANNINNIS